MMNLSHFSWKLVDEMYSVEQVDALAAKPKGFWVSVDGEDDWPCWCTQEEFRDIQAQVHYRAVLSPEANIRYITSSAEMLEFDKEFGEVLYPGSSCPSRYVNWFNVSQQCQGIIIAPYLWDMRRNGPDWYWSWDVASGCVWDSAAVASLELVRYGIPKVAPAYLAQLDLSQRIATQEWNL